MIYRARTSFVNAIQWNGKNAEEIAKLLDVKDYSITENNELDISEYHLELGDYIFEDSSEFVEVASPERFHRRYTSIQ